MYEAGNGGVPHILKRVGTLIGKHPALRAERNTLPAYGIVLPGADEGEIVGTHGKIEAL